MEKDLKPIYKKEPLRGFDFASDEIKRTVRAMNDRSSGSFFVSKTKERKKNDLSIEGEGEDGKKEKQMDMNHIAKGLIPLRNVLNEYEVKRIYRNRDY